MGRTYQLLLISLVAVYCQLMAARLALGAEPPPRPTVEALVDNADLVARATIISLSHGSIRARVDETIKGPKLAEVEFQKAGSYADDSKISPGESCLLVLCDALRFPEMTGKSPMKWTGWLRTSISLDRFTPDPDEHFFYYALNVDRDRLVTGDEVLRLARAYCAVVPEGHSRLIEPAFGDYDPASQHATPDRFSVPVSIWTEKIARQWAQSHEPQDQLYGIELLKEFKTSQNADILNHLLLDPLAHDYGTGPTHIRFYPVRQAALRVLNDWAMPPKPSPTLMDDRLNYHPAGWATLAKALGVLACVIFVVYAVRRAQPTRFIPITSMLIAIFLGVSWLRSFDLAEEWIWDGSSSRRVVSCDGWLQYSVIEGSSTPRAILHGAFDQHAQSVKYNSMWSSSKEHAWDWSISSLGAEWSMSDVNRARQSAFTAGNADVALGSSTRSLGHWCPYFSVRVPYIDLIAIFAVVPLPRLAGSAVRRIGTLLSRRPGCCRNCGYDLRASGQICPECGVPRPGFQPAAAT